MRPSRMCPTAIAFLLSLSLFALGCSGRTILAVDPFLCQDAGGQGCPPGLLDGLIGFWRLRDGTGSTIAHDGSGWSNDGTLEGLSPANAWVADGPEGTALETQGKGYVQVPPSASLDTIRAQLTLAAWMFVDGTVNDYATAISRQIAGGYGQQYHLSVNSQLQPAFFINTETSGQVVLFVSTTVAPRTWIHLAATYDGRMARLYLDGEELLAKAVTDAFALETNPLILGGNGNGNAKTVSELIPGRLSDVMIYRRALAREEIVRIRNGALLR